MKAHLLVALLGLTGVSSAALGATNISYTATADPNLSPDGMDANGNSADVWTLTYSGTGATPSNYGSFLGNSANNGGGGSGAGAGTSAWALYAGGGTTGNNEVQIGHTFVGGVLSMVQSVSVDFDAGYVDNGNQYGIRLLGPTGFVLSLSFVGGDSAYRYYDNAASGTPAGFGYNTDGFTFRYTQTGVNTYDALVTQGATTLGSWSGTVSGAPSFIQVYNANAGAGSNYDVFSNNLQIIPEPGSSLYVGCGLGFALLYLSKRKTSARCSA